METVNRNIDELIAAEYNPRRLTDDQYQQLKDSLQRFGIVDPVIVNMHEERKNIIVGGHQRLKVWRDLGNKEIPCVEVNLDRDQERELNVRLNKNTGEWDYNILAEEFDGSELSAMGFADEELQNIFEGGDEEISGGDPQPFGNVDGDNYSINIPCRDAEDQDEIYKKLKAAGYECKKVTS